MGRSRTIYIGNLPGDIREREIEDLFYKYGYIVDIDLKVPPRPPGYAFVEFEDARDAEDAIHGRDGYDFDGYRLRVELAHGGRGHSSYDYHSSYNSRGSLGSVSRRTDYQVLVSGLPSSASWQDLKDHMRRAGDVCFSEVYRERRGTIGIVDYTNYDDMRYAIRKLDDSEFRNAFQRSFIRVREYDPRYDSKYDSRRSYSRSRSRSYSRSPAYSRRRSPSRSYSPIRPVRLLLLDHLLLHRYFEMSDFLKRLRSRKHPQGAFSSAQPELEEEAAPESPLHEGTDNPAPHRQSTSDGMLLINSEGNLMRRRGKATCQDIRDLPPGTRVLLEINEAGQPCNIPESTLLASYMGVLAKDSALAPISFSDWRNSAMEPFKRRLLAELEAKFSFPPHIRPWIMQSLGTKWRGYKTSLKQKYWSSDRSVQDIVDAVPDGVDPVQWATLVYRWDEPKDKERSEQNKINAKKQSCPHTMGRHSSVRRQQDTETNDRLLLWKMNRLHKDGTWTSEDARQRWELACSILAESNLTPEDENTEENEKVFRIVMGPEHPGRVRCKGLGVTPSKYYSQGSSSSTASSYVSAGSARHVEQLETRVGGLQTEVGGLKTEMGGMKSEMGGMKSEIGRINETLTHLVSFLKRKSKKKSKKSKELSLPSSSRRERQDDDDEA